MDIELTIAERLGILALLPREGNLTTLRIVQRLQMDLSFDEADHAKLKFQTNDSQIVWDIEAEYSKVVSFGDKANQIVRDRLVKLNELGKLRMEHLGLCEKFGIED